MWLMDYCSRNLLKVHISFIRLCNGDHFQYVPLPMPSKFKAVICVKGWKSANRKICAVKAEQNLYANNNTLTSGLY